MMDSEAGLVLATLEDRMLELSDDNKRQILWTLLELEEHTAFVLARHGVSIEKYPVQAIPAFEWGDLPEYMYRYEYNIDELNSLIREPKLREAIHAALGLPELWLDFNSDKPSWSFAAQLSLLVAELSNEHRDQLRRTIEARSRAAITNAPYKKSEVFCITTARTWLAKTPDYGLGLLCSHLTFELRNKGLRTVTESTIRRWLKAARDRGELPLPQSASNPGRPRKSDR